MSIKRRTPKKKFTDQRKQAAVRGIEFLFSYAEWLKMWLDSGKWEQRGRGRGQYQMARRNDVGPYSVNNCNIETMEENQQTRHNVPIGRNADMINMYAGGASQSAVAAHFNLTQSHVSQIISGKKRNRSRG